MKKNKTVTIIAVSLLMMSTLLVTAIAQNENENTYQEITSGPSQGSVLWQAIGGMTGGITTEIKLVDQTNSGTPDTVLGGTDGGAMAIDLLTGEVYTRYTTLDPVLSITDIADIDGQGRADFVITTRNQQTPNVIAVSTETGNKLWDYKPMVEAYTEEDGLINKETISWCVDSIPAGSGMDVIVSSWRLVYRLSGNDGHRMWTFEGNNDIWTVVVTDDLTGDNKHDVLAGSQDGDIHLLNGRTGDPVWEHDLTDIYEKTVVLDAKKGGEEGGTVDIKIDLSLWSILSIEDVDGDNIPDVVVSSEDGFITLLSGDSGGIIWSKKITLQNEPNIGEENNVGVQSGIDDLLNFFNPRIKTIDDFDGDGLRDILVMGINRDYSGTAKIISSSTGAPRTRQDRTDPDKNTDPKDDDDGLVELDQESILFNTTGTDAIDIPVIWSTEALVNWNGNGNYSLILPHKNKIKLVDTQTKEVEPFFDHPILENAWLGRFQFKFFDNPNDSSYQEQLMIMTLGISGLLVVDPQTHDVLWDVNNMESVEVQDIGDITGDGTDDLMVLSSLGASSLARSIYAIDRVTGEELWRHSVSLTELATKGARGIIIEHDFTGDGHVDVLAYRQSDVPDDLLEMGNHSLVFVIDGADGSLAWERHVTNQLFYNSSLNHSLGLYEDWNVVNRRIATIDTAPDLSSDGIPDIFVGGQGGKVYLLDGSDGSQIWNMTGNEMGWLPWYPQIFTVQDPSRSGLLITDFSSMIFFTNISDNGSLSANYSWRYPENLSSPDNPELLSGSVRLIEDLNGDGRSDVMYFSIVEGEDAVGEHECHVLSGMDGSALGPGFSMGVGYPPQNSFAPGEDPDNDEFFVQDFNGNGFKDAVIFKTAEGKRAPPEIITIDGQTHQEIWVNREIFDYALSGGMPLRIIDDFNGDETPDIAVGTGAYKTEGANIQIIDGKTGLLLENIQYEDQTEFSDWNMAQPVIGISQLEDVSGDGSKVMIIQRTALIDEEDVNVVELVDIQTGRLLRQIPVGSAVAKDNGDINSDGNTDILVSQGNSLYCLNGDYSLSILSPQDDDSVDEEFLLEWDLKGVECEVFVDGISYGYFNDGEAEITLTGGEHEIIIETTDEFGGVLSDTITVNVPISNVPWIINITAVIALIIFIVVLIVIKRTKMKKREEHWREKRRKIESSKKNHGKKSIKVGGKEKKDPISGGGPKKMKKKPAKSMKPKKPKEPMTPKEPKEPMGVSK